MKKKISCLCFATLFLLVALVGCGSSGSLESSATSGSLESSATSGSSETPKKTYKLRMASLAGATSSTPAYVADQKGWFMDAGLEVEWITFPTGPAMVEAVASNSWDIGITGVGGVLSGMIGQDCVILSGCREDSGNLMLWARPDSPIVKAGKGHHAFGPEVYGTVDTWRDAMVLCPSGTTLHILLSKTLEGFGLTTDDIRFTIMDAPSANAAFLSGQGDVAATWSVLSLADDKKDFVAVSTGTAAQTNLITNIIASPRAMGDPELKEAIEIFLRVYYESVDWCNENLDGEAAEYFVDFATYDGINTDYETAVKNLTTDPFMDLSTTYYMMTDKWEGEEYSVMQGRILDAFHSFVAFGNYEAAEEAKITADKFDPSFVTKLFEESK